VKWVHHDSEHPVFEDEGGDNKYDDDERDVGQPLAQFSKVPHDGHCFS
jgi:hypothetical protein